MNRSHRYGVARLAAAALVLAWAPEAVGQKPTLQWVRQFGTSLYDTTFAVTARGDAVYAAGRVRGNGLDDAFVRKYDARGNEVRTRRGWTRTEPPKRQGIDFPFHRGGGWHGGSWMG